MTRHGYGSSSPFLSAAVLHSSQPPISLTTPKFLFTRSQTPFHSLTSLPGSRLSSLMRSKWPTTRGRSAVSISCCRS